MKFRQLLSSLLCVVVILGGCATAPHYTKPEYLGAGFDGRAITEIAIAPVVDMRIDKSEVLELDASVHNVVKPMLVERGYKVITFGDRSLISTLQALPTAGAVEPVVKDFLISNSPRHVFVVVLIDVYSKLTFGSAGNAEMVGYIVDQQRHEIVWRNKVVGKFGQGGLIGMAMKGMMVGAAIEAASRNLVYSIPPRVEAQ